MLLLSLLITILQQKSHEEDETMADAKAIKSNQNKQELLSSN